MIAPVPQDLRDRLLTRVGARAAALGAAVGTVVAVVLLVAGAPVGGAAAIGIVAGGAVAVILLTRSRHARTPDLDGLEEPWRRYLVDVVAARQRFDAAVDDVAAGPLRRSLEVTGRRLRDAVAEVDRIARHGGRLDRAAVQASDPDELRRGLTRAEQDADENPAAAAELGRRLAATEHTLRLAVEARQRLEGLDERLDHTVARVVELAGRPEDLEAAAEVAADVDSLVDDVASLRVALDARTAGGRGGWVTD